MGGNERREWERGLVEFESASVCEIPAGPSVAVVAEVSRELNPSAFHVFVKTLMLQFVAGFVTLLFCPQFGLALTSSRGVMPYLMRFGEGVCMFGCGAVFTGMTLLITSFALRPEEVRALRRHEPLQLISLATLALGALVCFGAQIVLTLGLAWLVGAVIGGAATLEIGWAMRQGLARKVLV